MCACGTNRPPRGAALIIAMLVMAVLLLAGTTFLTISSTENQIALNERVSAQAFLLAEAGLHKAIAKLNGSSTYSGETNTSLGSGSFTVTVTTAAGCTATSARDIVATGSVPVAGGQAQVQLRAILDQISYPFRWGAFAAVPNTVVSDTRIEKELWLKENSTTDSFDSSLGAYNPTVNSGTGGHIGANGDITLDQNTVVKGNVRAGDSIHLGGSVTVTGQQTSSLSPSLTSPGEPFPSVTPTTTPTSSLAVNGSTHNLVAGTYYYTTMTFSSSSSLTTSGGPVTIYVTGAVSLGNDVTLGAHPGTNLRIITKSDGLNTDFVNFTAGDNFRFYGGLFGKNTDISLGGSAQVYGSMIGRVIKAGDRTAIHFDHAMSDQEICHSGKFTVRRGTWREVIS